VNVHLKRLLFSLVPLVVVLGGAEAGLRAADWPTVDSSGFAHNQVYWTADPGQEDVAVPHRETQGSFRVSTDPHGLRVPRHPVEKPAGAQRVMTLGCSTTFGWGVDDAESYPARLESRLKGKGYETWQVINGGQPGYTSFQGLWLWDGVLSRFEPDIVLIGYVVQDARKAAYSDKSQAILQGDARFMKTALLYRSKLYLGLRAGVGAVQIRAKERGEGDEGGVHRVPPEDYVDNLRALVARAKAVGAEPVLFGYPLEREGYTGDHRRILKAAADELGVRHFDPQTQMEEATRHQTLYFETDRGHANARGNDLIARWVMEFLEEQGMLTKGG
jgi:lysophospholipase L1-like esterase